MMYCRSARLPLHPWDLYWLFDTFQIPDGHHMTTPHTSQADLEEVFRRSRSAGPKHMLQSLGAHL